MAAVFVCGHGRSILGTAVWLPPGVTVTTYAPNGQDLPAQRAIEVLYNAGNNLPSWTSAETGMNYELAALGNEEALQAMSAARAGGIDTVFVGEPGWPARAFLCGSPDSCTPETGHNCDGLLPLLIGRSLEIHIVGCCAWEEGASEFEDERTLEVAELARGMEELIGAGDLEGPEAQWQELDPKTQDLLFAQSALIAAWRYQREGRKILEAEGPESLYRLAFYDATDCQWPSMHPRWRP